jgi:hypothetical protein
MLINTDVYEDDIARAIIWIDGLIGPLLDKRIRSFEQRSRQRPLLASFYRNNSALEFALAEAKQEFNTTGCLPRGLDFDLAYAFIVSAQRIFEALPGDARKAFEGRIRDIAKNRYGARPFAFELSIATHLMHQGWDVELADLCGTARFDFLASREQISVEVECKTTSGDTGRKIHRENMNRLAHLVLDTARDLTAVPGCHLFRATIPDRLGDKEAELAAIDAAIAQALAEGSFHSEDGIHAEYSTANVTEWPEGLNTDEVRPFFENIFGVQNQHLIIRGRLGVSVVGVLVESSKPDQVIKTIAGQAKFAADQCTGTRPAIIAIQLVDRIPHSELDVLLKTSNGLHAIAYEVFKGSKRSHVDLITYAIPQLVHDGEDRTRRVSGDALMLFNPQPAFPYPEVRSIFADS